MRGLGKKWTQRRVLCIGNVHGQPERQRPMIFTLVLNAERQRLTHNTAVDNAQEHLSMETSAP